MAMKRNLGAGAALGALLAGPAQAQVNPIFDMPVLTMNAAIAANTRAIQRGTHDRSARAARVPISRAFAVSPQAGAAGLRMTYVATPALKKQVLAQFLDRVARNNPRYAADARRELTRQDYASIYPGIVAPYGLPQNDLAGSLAAYVALGYLIVNGRNDIASAAVQGARAQLAQALSDDPAFADPTVRAKTGEEFKILFVTLHAGWQSARREGTLAAYASGVDRMMQRQAGLNLSAVQTGVGFSLR